MSGTDLISQECTCYTASQVHFSHRSYKWNPHGWTYLLKSDPWNINSKVHKRLEIRMKNKI